MSEVIGIMEGAFFVSRGELIQWINDTFGLSVTRIEQLGAGNVYCQILDAIAPGKINMARVNWKAQLEWEFINNLKLLQQGFSKCGLNKHIDIERLSKAKYQDNLEFAQWMKRYYDLNNGANKNYDPVSRRGSVVPDFGFGEKQPVSTRGKYEEKTFGVKKRDGSEKYRSVGPSARHGERTRTDIVLKKNFKVGNQDVKGLYEYLKSMKALVEEKSIGENEKVQKIGELVQASLALKMFDSERKVKRSSIVDQIDEETDESIFKK